METRWAKSEWVRDTRDGRLTYYKESNSASGTTYEWSMDDYGVITDSGTQGTNDSILSGRDSCFPSDEVFNAGVTSTSASFSYQRTCSGNTWENLFEVSIYDAWTDDDCWTQITNLLAYVDLTNHQLVVRTPTAPWSGGPLLASNTSNVPLGDLLTSYCYGTLKVGYVRHETLGVVAVVADQSDTTIIPNSSSFTGTDAAQKYWTTPNAGWSPTSNEANWNYCEYGVTTSDAWMVGCKAAVWSDEAFHLVHTQNKDTACTDDSASGTNVECDWGPANQWVSIQPSDCYYTYGRTDGARDSGSSCSGWDTTGAC